MNTIRNYQYSILSGFGLICISIVSGIHPIDRNEIIKYSTTIESSTASASIGDYKDELFKYPKVIESSDYGYHKDELFKYPKVIESSDYGYRAVIDYSQKRDLENRDEIDEKRAYGKYISDVSKFRSTKNGPSGKYVQTGKDSSTNKFVIIYLHGMNGSREQGVNDYMFGGNFNRIQNLMVKNNGVYISPDFPDFGKKGTDQINSLILEKRKANSNAKVFVACGSSGGDICWGLFKRYRANIDGILLLGSTQDFSIDVSEQKKYVPIYIGHGTKDKSIPYMGAERLFRSIRDINGRYPIKLHLFKNGTHGTPIRMTDWKLILNWMDEVSIK